MNDEAHPEEKPSFEEIVAGKDVALGKEIVERLRSEDIGISIFKQTYTESTTKITYDRKPGQENFSVRKKQEVPSTLLGIVVPTENEGEFVYFGIAEQGFVFNTNYDILLTDFNPDINQVWYRSDDKFIESLSRVYSYYINITLREDENSEEFNKVFTASVERRREKVQQVKMRRAETRTKLERGLFGKND